MFDRKSERTKFYPVTTKPTSPSCILKPERVPTNIYCSFMDYDIRFKTRHPDISVISKTMKMPMED